MKMSFIFIFKNFLKILNILRENGRLLRYYK